MVSESSLSQNYVGTMAVPPFLGQLPAMSSRDMASVEAQQLCDAMASYLEKKKQGTMAVPPGTSSDGPVPSLREHFPGALFDDPDLVQKHQLLVSMESYAKNMMQRLLETSEAKMADEDGDIVVDPNMPNFVCDEWFYIDPEGNIQGPFDGKTMKEWFNAGFFDFKMLMKRKCDEEFVKFEDIIMRWERIPFVDGPQPGPMLKTDVTPARAAADPNCVQDQVCSLALAMLNQNPENVPEERIISEGTGPELPICERNLRRECSRKENCGLNHYSLPYLWQVQKDGWHSLSKEVVMDIEKGFCDKDTDVTVTKMMMVYGDGQEHEVELVVDFIGMVVELNHPPEAGEQERKFNIRRLSTPSYWSCMMTKKEEGGSQQLEVTDEDRNTFLTQWRWYFQVPGEAPGDAPVGWMPFEQGDLTPHQAVIESKFLANQDIYMFDIDTPNATICFVLNYKTNNMKNLSSQQVARIRRRPMFVDHQDVTMLSFLPWPKVETNPFSQNLPSNWYPLVTNSEFELVPINPEKMEYHLVASEFSLYLPGAKIEDIYRLQNPFLWHKYHSKRMQLERKNAVKEVQAFHGTDNETALRSILHQNFDWRLAGKNATKYGQGCYFAKNPAFSHKYTKVLAKNHRTMFLARVLIGKTCVGKNTYRRPPPIDENKPFGELYDSCVDDLERPRIFVIFDSDQCYPEYVINYNCDSS